MRIPLLAHLTLLCPIMMVYVRISSAVGIRPLSSYGLLLMPQQRSVMLVLATATLN